MIGSTSNDSIVVDKYPGPDVQWGIVPTGCIPETMEKPFIPLTVNPNP